MDIQQIPQADLLDILFDGRNKDYGAYALRKSYNDRLTRSILTTLAICLLLFIGYTVAGRTHHSDSRPSITETDLTPLDLTPQKKEMPVVIPRSMRPPAPTPTIRLVTTRIVPDDQASKDAPPPAVVPDNFRIGTTTNLTAAGDDLVRPIGDGDGNGPNKGLVNKPAEKDNNDDGIVDIVEIESSYKGGMAAWQRFLVKNFRPGEASEREGGDIKVVVRFIVDREGNVSDIEGVSGPAALQKEAIRVIRLSGKWEPAIQNGRKVKSYKLQPITVHWEQ